MCEQQSQQNIRRARVSDPRRPSSNRISRQRTQFVKTLAGVGGGWFCATGGCRVKVQYNCSQLQSKFGWKKRAQEENGPWAEEWLGVFWSLWTHKESSSGLHFYAGGKECWGGNYLMLARHWGAWQTLPVDQGVRSTKVRCCLVLFSFWPKLSCQILSGTCRLCPHMSNGYK